MQFLWSGFLVALLLLPVLAVAYVLAQRRRRPTGVRYSSLSLIRDAQPGSSRVRRHLPFVLLLAAFVPLIVAVARPVAVVAVPTNRTTIILTIDVSGSMCSTDILPTRLQAAEAAAAQFINAQSSSTQIGLVAFSSFAEIVQPPTGNRQALLSALAGLATGRRTAIGEGILTSIDAISDVDANVAHSTGRDNPGTEPPPVPAGAYAPDIVVLLTDGASNTGTDPLEAAQQAADRGVRVYTIGFGTADGGQFAPECAAQFLGREPGNGSGGGGFGGGGFGGGGGQGGFRRGIDEATLQQIATVTGATYYPAESAGQLESVFAKLPMNLVVAHEVQEISVGFVALGALLAALAMLLGRIWRPLP